MPDPFLQKLAVATLTFVAVASTSCRMEDSTSGSELVLTTFPVIEMITKAVAGDAVEVRSLLDSGKSPHTYDPSAADALDASRASIVIHAAENLDLWVAKISDAPRISLAKLLPDSLRLITASGSVDPHFWLDPLAVRVVVLALAETLCQPLAADCDYIRENAATFADELTMLDRDIRLSIGPIASTNVVVTTPFFGYFARRYDLRIVRTLAANEIASPGPRALAALARELESRAIDFVVFEAQESQVTALMIAELLDARVVAIDPLGAIGKTTYRELMTSNVDKLLEATG